MAKAYTPKQAEMTKPPRGTMLVTAPGGPRRRAGLDFGKIAIAVDLDDIVEEQFDAIMADPMLTVRPAETEPAKDD